jgi:hypothetical protein
MQRGHVLCFTQHNCASCSWSTSKEKSLQARVDLGGEVLPTACVRAPRGRKHASPGEHIDGVAVQIVENDPIDGPVWVTLHTLQGEASG